MTTKQDANQRYACLRRGRIYNYGSRAFTNGKWMPVSKAEYDHLKEHAVDMVSVKEASGTIGETRAKFEFRVGPPNDDGDTAPPSPRNRSR